MFVGMVCMSRNMLVYMSISIYRNHFVVIGGESDDDSSRGIVAAISIAITLLLLLFSVYLLPFCCASVGIETMINNILSVIGHQMKGRITFMMITEQLEPD